MGRAGRGQRPPQSNHIFSPPTHHVCKPVTMSSVWCGLRTAPPQWKEWGDADLSRVVPTVASHPSAAFLPPPPPGTDRLHLAFFRDGPF